MASEKREQILEDLSYHPFKSVGDMMATHGWDRSSLSRALKNLLDAGRGAYVRHSLEGRNPIRRYHLTRAGVTALDDTTDQDSDSPIMDRPGTTGKGIGTYHALIDNLAGVYRCASVLARCYKAPDLRTHLLSAGPLDAVVRLPDAPYSLGIMVYRPALTTYFEKKVRYYANAGQDRPSCLLVVSPGYMADHAVARLVALNYEGRAEIAWFGALGNPYDLVWRNPHSYDDETRPRDTWDMLDGVAAEVSRKFEPEFKPFKDVALPQAGWKPAIVLNHGERRALYTIADWPLANREIIAPLAALTEGTFKKVEGALRKRGLVRLVPVSKEEKGLALTDKGIVYVCRAARADYENAKDFWSAEDGERGKFRGGSLNKLAHDFRHTQMVYDIAGRFGVGAALVRARGIRITPAHKVERYFRPAYERNTRSIRPDAVIDVRLADGMRYVLLLEAERGNMSRQQMGNRLRHYDAYFREERSKHDDPVPPVIAVVLEDAGTEANFSAAQERAELTHLPTVLTNMSELARSAEGPFDPVWRRAGDYGQRRYLDELPV
ncbi:MAG: hypothetical protein OXC95_05455 [Dehalococcoidia bacterium]|nr:hypothetical protein [Dehalococcoidia bacterium]